MNTTKSIATTLGAAVLLILFAVPSSALSLEKQFITYEFESGVDETKRLNFVDNKFNDYSSSNLTGVVFAGIDSGIIVLEGEGSTIGEKLSELKTNNNLTNVQSVDTVHPTSSTYDDLRTHTETDPRGQADAENFESYRLVYLRVDVASGVNHKELVDEYHDDVAAEGIGGTFIATSGWGLMPTGLQGPDDEIADLVSRMKNDERLESVTIVHDVDISDRVFVDLWSHTDSDTRDTTK